MKICKNHKWQLITPAIVEGKVRGVFICKRCKTVMHRIIPSSTQLRRIEEGEE